MFMAWIKTSCLIEIPVICSGGMQCLYMWIWRPSTHSCSNRGGRQDKQTVQIHISVHFYFLLPAGNFNCQLNIMPYFSTAVGETGAQTYTGHVQTWGFCIIAFEQEQWVGFHLCIIVARFSCVSGAVMWKLHQVLLKNLFFSNRK